MKNLEIHEVLSKARLGRRRPCSWTDQKIVQILRSAFPLTFCLAIFVEYIRLKARICSLPFRLIE